MRFSRSYFEKKLLTYQKNQWIKFISNQIYGAQKDNNNNWEGGKRFYRHASKESIEASISKGEPISFVKFKDTNGLWVAFNRTRKRSRIDDSKRYEFIQIEPIGGNMNEVCGLIYGKYKLVSQSILKMDENQLKQNLTNAECGILLSFGGTNHPGHTLITEHWRIMNENGQLIYPELSKRLFENFLSV